MNVCVMRIQLLLLIFILSCGKFNFSPYYSDVENENINAKNLSKILAFSDASSAGASYSVAFISDPHDYYDGLEKQVKYINKNKSRFDFVIVSGDLSNVGLVSEFEKTKSYLDDLKIPYITTSGNHDLLINGAKIYKKIFGEDDYVFVYKDTKYILFNNNNWESSGAPNTNWVKQEIENNTSTHLVLVSHVPPDDSLRFTSSLITQYRNLVIDNGVDYYLNGHKHSPSAGLFGGVPNITIGASSKEVIVDLKITPGGLSHEFIYL